MSLPPIDGQTELIGIFGDPVAHTFSPAMHNAAFKALGMNWRYVPFHVTSENLKQAVEAIRALNLVGVNVTIPHKVEVIKYLDELDEVAEVCQAVNTIVNIDGKLKGYNTDGIGFYANLVGCVKEMSETNILFLGAGGAARAAIAALFDFYKKIEPLNKVFIYNRTVRKAHKIAERMEFKFPKNNLHVLSDKERLEKVSQNCKVIINCTSLGLHDGDPLPISSHLINRRHIVFDMVYRSEPTDLLKEAEQRGAKTINGLEMLLYQGVEAFKLWTGIEKPPVEVMRAALYEKLGIKK